MALMDSGQDAVKQYCKAQDSTSHPQRRIIQSKTPIEMFRNPTLYFLTRISLKVLLIILVIRQLLLEQGILLWHTEGIRVPKEKPSNIYFLMIY